MTEYNGPLPGFENPPVTEVVLSVQFGPLQGLRTAHLGRLWSLFLSDGFTRTEEHASIEPVKEQFDVREYAGDVGIKVRSFDSPPVPRVWFLNETGTELIQVQQDRFIHNWRRAGTGIKYIRYPQIRERFAMTLDKFEAFLRSERLGEIHANQCEVTYVNEIELSDDLPNKIDDVLTIWRNHYSDAFLPSPENAALAIRYLIAGQSSVPAGRLHVDVQPAFRKSDLKPLLILSLTARGEPLGGGRDHVMDFLDLGRQWIVRGFVSITTPEMHKIWRRTDAR